jgi:hypothetical protein
VAKVAFAAYQVQAHEFVRAGLAPPDDHDLVVTSMPHDRVVEAVLAGKAQAGFVRSGTLEQMAMEGKLSTPLRSASRIQHPRRRPAYVVAIGAAAIACLVIMILAVFLGLSTGASRGRRELRNARATVKTLRGLLPICMYCHNIRSDEGYWNKVEIMGRHSDATSSHGICPSCFQKQFPGEPRPSDAACSRQAYSGTAPCQRLGIRKPGRKTGSPPR